MVGTCRRRHAGVVIGQVLLARLEHDIGAEFEMVAIRRTHRVHVGSQNMACRWGQWSSAAKCIIIIIVNIDIIVPCSSGTFFYSSRYACYCSLRTGQEGILIGASRRRYRIQMMEAAVVGEEAELHVQAQMEGLASGLAARSDRRLPTLALTKAIHFFFTSLVPFPRLAPAPAAAPLATLSLPHLDPL